MILPWESFGFSMSHPRSCIPTRGQFFKSSEFYAKFFRLNQPQGHSCITIIRTLTLLLVGCRCLADRGTFASQPIPPHIKISKKIILRFLWNLTAETSSTMRMGRLSFLSIGRRNPTNSVVGCGSRYHPSTRRLP